MHRMCPTPEFKDLLHRLADRQSVEVATGIVMHWDRVDKVAAHCAIQRMAIHKHKSVEEVATAIIRFAALGRAATVVDGA
jgi:AmiR/NasT family two-component response regulator